MDALKVSRRIGNRKTVFAPDSSFDPRFRIRFHIPEDQIILVLVSFIEVGTTFSEFLLQLSGQKQQIKLTLKGSGGSSQSKRPGISENSDSRKGKCTPKRYSRIESGNYDENQIFFVSSIVAHQSAPPSGTGTANCCSRWNGVTFRKIWKRISRKKSEYGVNTDPNPGAPQREILSQKHPLLLLCLHAVPSFLFLIFLMIR